MQDTAVMRDAGFGRLVIITGVAAAVSALILLGVSCTKVTQTTSFPDSTPNSVRGNSTSPHSESADVKKIVFTRNSSVFLKDVGTGEERQVVERRNLKRRANGQDIHLNVAPSLDPTGTAIAFHYQTDLYETMAAFRVLDLVTDKVREFPELANTNSSHPQWSPDGKLIAFDLFKPGVIFHIGILDVESGKWRDITAGGEFDRELGVWLGGWARDGLSVVCHSSQFLYRIAIDGRVLFKLPVESFSGGGSLATSTRISLTADEKRLLFESGDPDDPAILIYDLGTRNLSRVTPKDIGGIEPRWLPGEKDILFTCFDNKKRPKVFNICQIGDDGKGLKQIIENGRYASYSTN